MRQTGQAPAAVSAMRFSTSTQRWLCRGHLQGHVSAPRCRDGSARKGSAPAEAFLAPSLLPGRSE